MKANKVSASQASVTVTTAIVIGMLVMGLAIAIGGAPAFAAAEAQSQVMVDLAACFNGDGISSNRERSNGDFDGWKGTFAAELLPASGSTVTYGNVVFRFPDKASDALNMVSAMGQEIRVPTGTYKACCLLAAASNGSFMPEIVLGYSDGSTEAVKVGITDWCRESQQGEAAVIRMDHRHDGINDKDNSPAPCLFRVSFHVDSNRELVQVSLPEMPDVHIFAMTFVTVGFNENTDVPAGPMVDGSTLLDGFEGAAAWVAAEASWEGNATERVAVATENFTEGGHSLEIAWGAREGRGIAYVNRDINLSGAGELRIDLFNPGEKPVGVSIALCTGSAWTWQESAPVPAAPGWNTAVSFDLTAPKFKSAASGWQNTATLVDAGEIKRLVIMVFPADSNGGSVFVDRARTLPLPEAGPGPEESGAGKRGPMEEALLYSESFEKSLKWKAVGASWGDGDQSKEARISAENASEGSHSLEAVFALPKQGAATFITEDLSSWSNWSEVTTLKVDIFNPTGAPMQLSMAACTGSSWSWNETPAVAIAPGWNRDITFDITAKTWKNSASGWRNEVDLPDATDVHRLVFKFFMSGAVSGSLFIDNVRLSKLAPAKKADVKLEIKSVANNLDASLIVEACHKFEVTAKIDANFDNPYDPRQIEVIGVFTSPSGTVIEAPGFYYQDFERKVSAGREFLTKAGQPVWKVRFTPTEVGIWQCAVRAKDRTGQVESDVMPFMANDTWDPGFVRVSCANPRMFEFDNGSPAFLIGQNVAWYDARGTAAYDKWFREMSGNGANYARIWLASWGFAPEWQNTRLGNYDARQDRAYQLDHVFELAEEKGIYLMLCLISHGQFGTRVDSEWACNPYNAKNGGPLAQPVDFLTDPESIRLFEQKVRYIAARWGYSTHLFSWEWWNEVDLTDGLSNDALLKPWVKEMTAYMRSVDPYSHLISLSYAGAGASGGSVWDMPEISYCQVHDYSNTAWGAFFGGTVDKLSEYGKPVLFAEFGVPSKEPIDPSGIHLHDGLWAGLTSGSAGTGMLWWWDSYVEPNDLYPQYAGLARFVAGEPLNTEEFTQSRIEVLGTDQLEAHGITSPGRSLIRVSSKAYTYDGYNRLLQDALWEKVGQEQSGSQASTSEGSTTQATVGQLTGAEKGAGLAVEFPTVKGGILVLSGMAPGAYKVEFWNTLTGEIVGTDCVGSSSGEVRVVLVPIHGDIAIKLIKE
ncbi:MAG: DUF5060 domain-containing protein [Clostridia bacterium]|nr:DUF5060 domain-containing protein [Clostridia bacterium]